jgi:hypothetical protein
LCYSRWELLFIWGRGVFAQLEPDPERTRRVDPLFQSGGPVAAIE